jgi:hypothetical protein
MPPPAQPAVPQPKPRPQPADPCSSSKSPVLPPSSVNTPLTLSSSRPLSFILKARRTAEVVRATQCLILFFLPRRGCLSLIWSLRFRAARRACRCLNCGAGYTCVLLSGVFGFCAICISPCFFYQLFVFLIPMFPARLHK